MARWVCAAIAAGVLLIALGAARAAPPFDHSKSAFPLTGKHQKVACESCHPAAGATRRWAGVATDCHGCHGDRGNHKGANGPACERCHDVTGWKSIRHPRDQHRFALVGVHDLPCARCHAAGAHLAPAQTCVDCHAQPHGGTSAPCTTCHDLVAWKSVSFRQHTFSPAALPGAHRTASCLGCHPGFRFANTQLECASCHERDQPHERVGTCSECHPDNGATWATLALKPAVDAPARTIFAVGPAFDHLAHGRSVAAGGSPATCSACHATQGTTALSFAQRPAMQVCEVCHDGKPHGSGRADKAVFAALGTRCDRCHQRAASQLPESAAPNASNAPASTTFSHEQHAKLKVNIDDCRACHGAGTDWRVVRAGRDQHQPCQGCHAPEFRKRDAAICLVCHDTSLPFAPNALKAPHAIGPEWRSADVPHAAHAAAKLECQTCHPAQAGLDPSSRAAADGHPRCATCHTGDTTQLTLDRCAGCHVLASAPRPASPDRPWSTRDRFRHDAWHRGRPCETCHQPSTTNAMTLPAMNDCAACHDGAAAFKVTGFQCARCHARAEPITGQR